LQQRDCAFRVCTATVIRGFLRRSESEGKVRILGEELGGHWCGCLVSLRQLHRSVGGGSRYVTWNGKGEGEFVAKSFKRVRRTRNGQGGIYWCKKGGRGGCMKKRGLCGEMVKKKERGDCYGGGKSTALTGGGNCSDS